MAAGACFESGWCDLSGEHERVRRELEGLVRCYVERCGGEYWMAVIVAPYGSGKTTLLRHLEAYARKLGAASLRVELAEVVDFIVERYGTIHESELPRVLEEFACERLGDASVYVLLVDEIEESYDILRGIVTYETSPFRGVAEAIRTGRSRVYVVLALGPSSTLKEAIFGPVAWRSRVYTLPLLPKSVVRRMVEEAVSLGDGVLAELMANMVWWASKGRIAWARMLVDTVVPKLASALREGPEAVEALLLGEEALGREVVEGIPLFDRHAFREVRRLFEDRRLAPLLAALPGPVPVETLSTLAGGEVLPEPGTATVFGRSLVSVEDLLGEAQSWLERFSRAKGFSSASVEHAMTALEHAVYAWSVGGKLLYDVQALRELFSLAADIAREIYADDPNAAYLLESLNPDLLSPPVERARSLYAALRPSVIGRLYPTASSTPLLGCARRAGIGQVSEIVESLSLDELAEYSGKLAEATGLAQVVSRRGLRVLVLPRRAAESAAEELACRMLAGERLLVIVADPKGSSSVPRLLRAAATLSGSLVVEAGERMSIFLYSLLYGYSVGTSGCSPDNFTGIDRRGMRLYSDLLRSVALDALASSSQSIEALAGLAARLEERYGAAARAAARVVHELGEAAAALASSLDRLYARSIALLQSAARLLGGSPPEPPPKPSEVLAAVEELAAKLPEDVRGGGLDGLACSEYNVPSVLAALAGLGAAARADNVVSALEAAVGELKASMHGLPRLGVLEEVAALASGLAEVAAEVSKLAGRAPAAVELLAQLLDQLAGLARTLASKIAGLAKMYDAAIAAASGLPGQLREKALKALEEEVAASDSLEALGERLGRAPELLAELARLSGGAGDELESLKTKLLEKLDRLARLLSGEQLDTLHKVEGEVEAET